MTKVVSRLVLAVATAALGLGLASAAEAVILHPEHDDLASLRDLPSDGIIGKFNGASAVAISPYFFLASRHQGTASTATFAGQTYNVAATHTPGNNVDLRLVQISLDGPALPAYAPLYDGELEHLFTQELVIGGFGATRGDPYHDPPDKGYHWGSPAGSQPVWGANTVSQQSQFSDDPFGGHTHTLQARFAEGNHTSAIVGEASVGQGDSGGGWLLYDDEQWHTVGVTMAVQHPDVALYAPQFERLWAVDMTYQAYHDFVANLLVEPGPTYPLGDMNLDGVVNTADVAPFVLALTNPDAYEAEFGIDPVIVGDINGDGAFNTADVAPFVQLLVDAGAATVPEPGTAAVLLTAAGLLLCRRCHAGRR